MAIQTFNIGDRVVFARSFLRNIGAVTGFLPQAVGNVVGEMTGPRHQMRSRQLLLVLWDGMTEPQAILSCHLWHKDRLHLEPA